MCDRSIRGQIVLDALGRLFVATVVDVVVPFHAPAGGARVRVLGAAAAVQDQVAA